MASRILLLIVISFSAGFSEDSDYTSDINFPINSHVPNAATSQYLQAANNLQPPIPNTPQKSLESYDSQHFETSQEYPSNGDLNTQAFNSQDPSLIPSQEVRQLLHVYVFIL